MESNTAQRVVAPPNGQAARQRPVGVVWLGRRRLIVFAVLAVVLVVAAALAYGALRARAAVQYVTSPVVRRLLVQSVSAAGTVNAQDTVLVGTQVSGTIQRLYVDYNSRVRQGEVLARLDPSQFQANVAQANAALDQASAQARSAGSQASGAASGMSAARATAASQESAARAAASAVDQAQAQLQKAQSDDALARRTLERDTQLLSRGYIAQSQYDADAASAVSARSALQTARTQSAQAHYQASAARSQAAAGYAQFAASGAQAAASGASAQGAAAAVAAARAQLEQDRLNLDRTVIVSPVDGTVVARNVSVGQTVAASFQTPTLFTIARDLNKMEVDIAVGEPDIGGVHPGETVTFSVLAYPNRQFQGRVSQVRVNPTTVQNVVTYTVVVLVGNRDGALLPGMTANALIAVASAQHALVVPTAAFSYHPQNVRRARPSGVGSASPWGQSAAGTGGIVFSGSTGRLFVLRDGEPRPVAVRVDLVSGTQAAVTPLRGSLGAGDAVITGDNQAPRRTSAAVNPTAGIGRMVR